MEQCKPAMTAKLRVAIIVSGPSSREICNSLASKYAPESNYVISLIIVDEGTLSSVELCGPRSFKSSFLRKLRIRIFNLSLWVERYTAYKLRFLRNFSSPPLRDLGIPVRTLPKTSRNSGSSDNPSEIATLLASFQVETVIHFGSELALAMSSGLSAIDEVLLRTDGSSSIESIEALCFRSVSEKRPTVEAEVILHKKSSNSTSLVGNISVPSKWLTSMTVQAFQAKASYLAHTAITSPGEVACERIGAGRPAELMAPTALVSLRQLQVALASMFYRLFSQLFRPNPQWHVAFTNKAGIEDFLEENMLTIPNPKGRFFADPFLITENEKTFCFVEDYWLKSRKGQITVIELGSAGHKILGPALTEDFHLSFPFVFRDGIDIYMCPESASSGQIRLYRALDFPLKWSLDLVLMENVSAADTLLFYRDKKWWMLTNLSPEGGPNHQSELHLFSADKLRTTEWHPHPKNPLVNDPTRARNAGLMISGTDFLRAYQQSSFDKYGAGIGVSRISKLSEKEYSEEVIKEIFPQNTQLQGMHTLSVDNNFVVTDFFFNPKNDKTPISWSLSVDPPN